MQHALLLLSEEEGGSEAGMTVVGSSVISVTALLYTNHISQTFRRNETLLRWAFFPNHRDKQESPSLHVLGKHRWPLQWDVGAFSTVPEDEPIKQSDIRDTAMIKATT